MNKILQESLRRSTQTEQETQRKRDLGEKMKPIESLSEELRKLRSELGDVNSQVSEQKEKLEDFCGKISNFLGVEVTVDELKQSFKEMKDLEGRMYHLQQRGFSSSLTFGEFVRDCGIVIGGIGFLGIVLAILYYDGPGGLTQFSTFGKGRYDPPMTFGGVFGFIGNMALILMGSMVIGGVGAVASVPVALLRELYMGVRSALKDRNYNKLEKMSKALTEQFNKAFDSKELSDIANIVYDLNRQESKAESLDSKIQELLIQRKKAVNDAVGFSFSRKGGYKKLTSMVREFQDTNSSE